MYDRRPPYHRRFYRPPHLRGPSRCGSARDGGGVVRPRLPDFPLRHGHGLRPRRCRSGPRVPRFRNRIGFFSRRGFRCRLCRLGLFSRLGPFFCRDFCCSRFLCSGFRILFFSRLGSRLGPFFCRDFCCGLFLCSGFRILVFSRRVSHIDSCSRRIFRICFSFCHGFCIGLFSRLGSGPAFSAHADARSAAGRRNPFPGTGEPLPGR